MSESPVVTERSIALSFSLLVSVYTGTRICRQEATRRKEASHTSVERYSAALSLRRTALLFGGYLETRRLNLRSARVRHGRGIRPRSLVRCVGRLSRGYRETEEHDEDDDDDAATTRGRLAARGRGRTRRERENAGKC